MRALRRITTPATVLALAGCSFPVDEFRVQSPDAAALSRDGALDDAAGDDASIEEASPADAAADDTRGATTDAAEDACTCVDYNPGGKCMKWEPASCGKE